MPTYLYQEILPDGTTGEMIEISHPMDERPPKIHPRTGYPIRRVFTAPRLGLKHTPGKSKNLTSDQNLEKSGFTKFVRDKVTGEYHRTVGKEGPKSFKPPDHE
ncbi:MAG: hypothetical protein LAT55_04940 [Opitutales bacterium]|nr:hypothetical protein [Opitutales bacterium]